MAGSITHRGPDNFAERIDHYVPRMMYAADVHDDGFYKISLGTPNAPDTDAIVDGVTVTGGVTLTSANFNGVEANGVNWESSGRYGQTVSIVFSAAGTPVVQIKGHDYLGQRMQENLTGNGTTPVTGSKAFKRIDEIVVPLGVTGTIDVGTLGVFGVPYKTVSFDTEIVDGTGAAMTGTLTQADLTDPATAVTGDPRGTYDPHTATNGTAEVVIVAQADNWRNADDNGGYHGIKHFAG